MNEIIEIIDINGRKRQVLKSSIRVVSHQVKDAIHGGTITEKFVEVQIISRHRGTSWKEWYPLEKFVKMNPKLAEEIKP